MLDDIKMIDRHFMHSLNANGNLLGAWLRIKKEIEELAQQTYNTGSPKLPSLKEVLKGIFLDYPHDDAENYERIGATECYEFIARQLRAGA